ncbi:MAG: hypothetical protein ACRD43_08675, partial [Pyrinomonadaceae bacterium]
SSALPASGTIDFLTFRDFCVNGISVDIEEYKGPIFFKKGDPLELPHPIKVFVGSGGVLEAAWSEFKESRKDWTVTGRIFAFGKFKRMGMTFKRVIPVDFNVTVRKPTFSSK